MLFRLVKADGEDGGILGFDFIEVIAVVPYAIIPACTDEDYKAGREGPSVSWAAAGIQSIYICRTEHGITRFNENDLWDEIEAGTYCEDTPDAT